MLLNLESECRVSHLYRPPNEHLVSLIKTLTRFHSQVLVWFFNYMKVCLRSSAGKLHFPYSVSSRPVASTDGDGFNRRSIPQVGRFPQDVNWRRPQKINTRPNWSFRYTAFVNAYDKVLSTLSSLGKVKKFQSYAEEIRRKDRTASLESFLIMPVQRVPRYLVKASPTSEAVLSYELFVVTIVGTKKTYSRVSQWLWQSHCLGGTHTKNRQPHQWVEAEVWEC